MARGESPKERPISIGLAIVAIVVVAGICTLSSVIASMHPAQAPVTYAVPPALAEPFPGATAAFGTFTSRDATRALLTAGTAPARDPVAARSALEATLRSRGYVQGATAETSLAVLPLDLAAADLEGACGVILLLGDVTTTLTAAQAAGGPRFLALDPSAMTVALCGAGNVHVEGSGAVTARTWLYPGLTPSALTSTGLPADALLAHAEAEALLRARGYAPVDELVELPMTASSAGGFLNLTLPVVPPAGCIPFVIYAEGAGRPQIPPGRFDSLTDRGLVGAVSCASGANSWAPSFVDDSVAGGRAWARAYAPDAHAAGVVSIAAAHVVGASSATWPTAISP